MKQLKYVQGDLLKAATSGRLNVIAHQANCFCKGRRGIAPLIFKTFPGSKFVDDQTDVGGWYKMGDLSHAFNYAENSPDDPIWVFNLYGQYHFDQYSKDYGTRYWALGKALEKMAMVIETRKSLHHSWTGSTTLEVGFPLIGCGLAGGDWEIVEEMIKYAFRNSNVNISIYTLDKLSGKEYVDC